MSDLLTALLSPAGQAPQHLWRSFFNRLDSGGLAAGEAAAVLSCMSARLPDHNTVAALLAALDERRPPTFARYPRAVNIVGTGGGPKTFNISTAAAFVAAAMGVPVVKTGSRAFSSSHGSHDLLDRLGVRLTRSYEETSAALDQYGIAFCGQFVYPREIGLLARAAFPLPMKALGGAVNLLGPLLAAVPVAAQVTGVSDQTRLSLLRRLAAARPGVRTWFCVNDSGADELLSFGDNTVHFNDRASTLPLRRNDFGFAPGTLADLAPVGDDELVDHFLRVLEGKAGVVAEQCVAFNAAALAVAGDVIPDWQAAVTIALSTMQSGAALDLAQRMRVRAHV